MCLVLRELHPDGIFIFQVEPYLEHLVSIHEFFSSWGSPEGLDPYVPQYQVYLREKDATEALLELQSEWSHIPKGTELLVETLKSREGHHAFFYTFEGHLLHEWLAALLAYRLSKVLPMTLSLSVNDYGFELLSDREFDLDEDRVRLLCRAEGLVQDILNSVNASEMAKRQFRDIARIAGLVFQGYPGRRKPTTQVQASTSLLFNVFQRYDPENFLLKQATQEVLDRLSFLIKRFKPDQLLILGDLLHAAAGKTRQVRELLALPQNKLQVPSPLGNHIGFVFISTAEIGA